jgi:CheY-like chemotaxis protein
VTPLAGRSRLQGGSGGREDPVGNKILLIDDSVTVQKIITLTFSDEGVEVVTMDNGEEAITRLQYMRPALVMADVSIPGKNGYDVCAYIKNNPELKHIPVILLIPGFETYDAERARRVGADHHLTKPFQSIRSLIATVKNLIEGDLPVNTPAVGVAGGEMKRGLDLIRSRAETVIDPLPEEPSVFDQITETAAQVPPVPEDLSIETSGETSGESPGRLELDEVLDLDAPDEIPISETGLQASEQDEIQIVTAVEEVEPAILAGGLGSALTSRDIAPEVVDDIVERVAQRVVELLAAEISRQVREVVTPAIVDQLGEELAGRISGEVARSLSGQTVMPDVAPLATLGYDDPDQLLELDEF